MKLLTKLEENVLLMILKLEDDAYIVTIKAGLEKFQEKSISFGALYLALNRLIRDGYLQTEIGEATSTKGGRAKKYYRLTKKGALKLKDIHSLQRKMWENFDSLYRKILEKG
jgi:DNA-binding PadR family transcriptional regulator